MNKEVELTAEDRRQLYLEMMDEIDAFCRSHNIRYSLTCGTLIGAIRHKGFIPWDDDLDIMMPLPDMLRFRSVFKSDNLRYVDIDVDRRYAFSFSRIESLKTYTKGGHWGLCIDLYPLLGLPKTDLEIEQFLKKARTICDKRLTILKWTRRIQRICSSFYPKYVSNIVKRYRDFMFQYPFEDSVKFYHMGGYPNVRAINQRNYFNELIDVEFEGKKYMAIKGYDEALTHGYGDYMTPPPEDQRIPYHEGHYFWK